MTAPAPDIKPEAPRRTEIDPIRTIEALRVGEELCFRSGADPDKIKVTDMVWALLIEAAKTERALLAPKGKGYGNGWPEIALTRADHVFAESARLADGMPQYIHPPQRDTPTAAQITRYDEVMIWLRFCHADDQQRARDVLWGLASRRNREQLRKETGLTQARLRSVKCEQLRIIAERLKSELKDFLR